MKQLLAMDFSVNGFRLATGSDDHTIRIWDLRTRREAYQVPAHSKLISSVRFAPHSGEFLVSASFDGTVKVWSGRDYKPLASIAGHEGRISGVGKHQLHRDHIHTNQLLTQPTTRAVARSQMYRAMRSTW